MSIHADDTKGEQVKRKFDIIKDNPALIERQNGGLPLGMIGLIQAQYQGEAPAGSPPQNAGLPLQPGWGGGG